MSFSSFPARSVVRIGLSFSAVAAGLWLCVGVRAAPELVTAGLVARLAAELRTNNPSLRALSARETAAQLHAAGTRRWADPQFQAGGAAYRTAGMARDNGDVFYGLQQTLPLLGKEKAAQALNDASARAATTLLESRFTELRRDLAVALFEEAFQRESLELARQDLAWLDAQHASVQTRLASGRESAAPVLRLENEQSRRRLDLTNATARLADADAAVRRLLGRTDDLPAGDFALPPVANAVTFGESLVRVAEASEPMARTRHSETELAARTLDATRRSGRPDIAAGIQAYQYTGDGGIAQGMLSVSLNLPWFNRARYKRDIQRDGARLDASRLEEADTQAEVRLEVHRLVTAIDAARREALLYRDDIRPRTLAALRSLEAAWIPGGMDLRDLLETRRQLVEADRSAARATTDYWDAVSQLLLCCGLEDLESLNTMAPASKKP